MKQILLSIVMVLFVGMAWAQSTSGQVAGTVLDEKGNPVPYASVILKGSNYGDATDESGNFHFSAPAGKYVLEVSEVGFDKNSFPVEVSANQLLQVPKITLFEAEAILGEFLITGNRSGYKCTFRKFTVGAATD